jgi:hypothetical protein
MVRRVATPSTQPATAPIDEPVVQAARASVERFVRWLEAFGEVSHDPYDFWATPLGARAKERYHRGGLVGKAVAAPFVALDLVVPRSRGLVRKKVRYANADAHYAMGFFALARGGDRGRNVERGQAFLTALEAERSPGFDDPGWGYPFDWPTRYGVFEAGWPLITTIPYCYEAFEDGHAATGEPRYLELMEGTARLAAERFPVTPVGEDGAEAASYTPFDTRQVVNANAYRAYLLTTAGLRFERDDWVEAGRRNMAFVVESQRPDGSWPYSIDGSDDFVDNFHTCFNLKNLLKIWTLTGAEDVREAIVAGYGYYLANLIDEMGLPLPFAKQPRLTLHKRDLYDYAEGINLAQLARELVPEANDVLRSLVLDLTGTWQLSDGHFVTRKLLVGRNAVPYHRWAQSPAFRSLARVAVSDAGTTRAAHAQ